MVLDADVCGCVMIDDLKSKHPEAPQNPRTIFLDREKYTCLTSIVINN
jgi:hypothetical protein